MYVTHHLHQPQILYGCQGKIASGKVTDWALAARACVYVVVVCTLHMSRCRRGRHMSRYVDICLDMCRRTTVWTLHMSRCGGGRRGMHFPCVLSGMHFPHRYLDVVYSCIHVDRFRM